MNRIQHPRIVRLKKEPKIKGNDNKEYKSVRRSRSRHIERDTDIDIDFKYDYNDDFNKFKDSVEENILCLKNKLDNISDISSKNKKEISDVLDLIQQVKNQMTVYSQQTEEYKKITNERIEKLVKLFLIINSKMQSLEINSST